MSTVYFHAKFHIPIYSSSSDVARKLNKWLCKVFTLCKKLP